MDSNKEKGGRPAPWSVARARQNVATTAIIYHRKRAKTSLTPNTHTP